MLRTTHQPLFRVSCIFLILCTSLFPAASYAFITAFGGTGGGANGIDENSRFPIKIELRGFLNTDPVPESLVVISLGVMAFRGVYRLDVRHARLPDDPRVPVSAILRRAGKYTVDFHVIGRRDLLSKIGQSPPGTPLVVVGMFQQRRRRLQLLSIDIVDKARVTEPDPENEPQQQEIDQE